MLLGKPQLRNLESQANIENHSQDVHPGAEATRAINWSKHLELSTGPKHLNITTEEQE